MLELHAEHTNAAAMVVRAVSNTLRKKILNLIAEFPGLTVMQIYKRLQIGQSVASKQLLILRQTSMVRTERRGIFVHYYPEAHNIHAIFEMVLLLAPYFQTGKVTEESTAL